MKHYDKIFLIVSLIILGASAVFYALNEPKIKVLKDDTAQKLARLAGGEKWESADVAIKTEESLEWPAVKAQDADGLWLFQVFTPPKIWVAKDGKFIAKPPYRAEEQKKVFPIRFGEISNSPYYVIYKGYFGDIKAPIVQLEDMRNKSGFIGKLNEEIVIAEASTGKPIKTGLTLRSFDRKRVKDEKFNTYTDYITITIEDKNLGKTVSIYSDKPTLLDDQRIMILKSVADPNFRWDLKAAGESTELGGFKYTVKEIDFVGGSAVIEQTQDGAPVQTVKVQAAGNAVISE